jgi:hypothetical protein
MVDAATDGTVAVFLMVDWKGLGSRMHDDLEFGEE